MSENFNQLEFKHCLFLKLHKEIIMEKSHQRVTIISSAYINMKNNERTILYRIERYDSKTRKSSIKFRFSGWNPLPVIGEFESSYSILEKFLKDNGYERLDGLNVRTTNNIYVKE